MSRVDEGKKILSIKCDQQTRDLRKVEKKMRTKKNKGRLKTRHDNSPESYGTNGTFQGTQFLPCNVHRGLTASFYNHRTAN